MKRSADRLVVAIALSASCAFTCILHATTAAADSNAESKESATSGAGAWTAEASKLEEAGRWREALDRWKHAAAIAQTPQITFHVGLCEARSGALVEAAIDLDRAIALARASSDTEVEAAAQAARSETRARTPTLELDVPDGEATRLILDGTELSTSALGTPMPLNPGAHTAVVVFGPRRVEKDVSLHEGEVAKLAIAPPATSEGAASNPAPTLNDDAPTSDAVPLPSSSLTTTSDGGGRTHRFMPYFLLVSGVMVTGAGGAFWVFRTNEIKALERACPTHTGCDPALRKHDANGKLYTSASLALLSSGIIGMGWGAGMLLFGKADADASVVARLVTHVVSRVVPEALPGGGGGASVVGRF